MLEVFKTFKNIFLQARGSLEIPLYLEKEKFQL